MYSNLFNTEMKHYLFQLKLNIVNNNCYSNSDNSSDLRIQSNNLFIKVLKLIKKKKLNLLIYKNKIIIQKDFLNIW